MKRLISADFVFLTTSRARVVHAVHYLIASSGKSARVLRKHWISQTRADNNEAPSTTHGRFKSSVCRGKMTIDYIYFN